MAPVVCCKPIYRCSFRAATAAPIVFFSLSLSLSPTCLEKWRQGEDGRKFATRSGDAVRLKDLLDEAVRIAAADLVARGWGEQNPAGAARGGSGGVGGGVTLAEAAAVVGLGAVKYADLAMHRESSYRFSCVNRALIRWTSWFCPRELHARTMDTRQVSERARPSVAFAAPARKKGRTSSTQTRALRV